jgi:hypothetical protein
MNITMQIDGEYAEEELRSLHDWLLNEPDISHNARVLLVASEPSHGQMGDTIDLISLVSQNAIGLAGLVPILMSWHENRRRKPTITIERGDTKVIFTGANPDDVARVLNGMEDD